MVPPADDIWTEPDPLAVRPLLVPLSAIILGVFAVALSTSMLPDVLPALELAFHSDLSSLQWALTSYAVALAAVIPLSGWLCDRYGVQRLLGSAVTVVAITSALCAAAQNAAMLIVFSVLRGLAGGFVGPAGLATVYLLAPRGKLGLCVAIFGVPLLLPPIAGSLVAAELLHSVAWQWVFLIPVPFCLAALLAGVAIQMPAGQKQETFLDLPGMVLGPLAFAALAYGMAETSTGWTSTGALAGLLGGSAALVAFIAVELRAPHPLLDLRVFGAGAFRLTVVTQWLGQIALAGGGFLFSQFLLLILGYHILDGGYTTLLLAQLLGTAVCLLIGGLLFDRRGARLPAVTGLALVTIGTVGLAQLSALTRPSDLLLWLFLQGAGSGLLTVALQTRMLSSVPRDLVRRVAALTGALQGMLVGLAGVILATVLTNRFGSLEPVLLTARLHHPLDIGAMLATALAPDYNHLLMIMAGFALAGALLALTLRPVLAPTDGEVPEKSWVEPEPDPAAISVDIPPGQPDV